MSNYIENTLSIYEERILAQYYGLCPDCNKLKTGSNWCKGCNSKRFQQNFNEWTSGNNLIDKFIQDAQIKARNREEVMEWIPYDNLKDIQFLAKGGFSKVYKAIWLYGRIEEWDKENLQWKRKCLDGQNIALKSLNNSLNFNEENLNEVFNNL